MQTTIQHHSFHTSSRKITSHTSVWRRFINWADSQEEYRFGWTAGILVGHGCIVTIFTMLAIVFTGNNFIFWPFAIAAMGMCVVTNLAAMPTKVTIPVFVFSLLIDLAIIVIAIGSSIIQA
jgi:hypothetical protein